MDFITDFVLVIGTPVQFTVFKGKIPINSRKKMGNFAEFTGIFVKKTAKFTGVSINSATSVKSF